MAKLIGAFLQLLVASVPRKDNLWASYGEKL
jgi:hypothetical protein